MIRFLPVTLALAASLLSLTGCGDSKPTGGGNVTMRDMEVVDGTANDSMADLDNATADGTLLSNAGELPPVGTNKAPAGNASGAALAQNDTAPASGNTSAPD